MGECTVLEAGDLGQVLMDLEASYVRNWFCGQASDPLLLEIMEAALDCILTHRLRFVIADVSRVRGQAPLEFLERLRTMVPLMVDAGCRTQFSIMPNVTNVVAVNARTYQEQERQGGMLTIEVPNVESALSEIARLNAPAGRAELYP